MIASSAKSSCTIYWTEKKACSATAIAASAILLRDESWLLYRVAVISYKIDNSSLTFEHVSAEVGHKTL
jgi:hypothetical protein